MNIIVSSILIKNQLYKKFLYDYVSSLRENYKDDCLIFSYSELDNEIIQFLNKNNIKIIQKQLTMNYVNNQRIIDIYNCLDILNYDKIIITDIDIWFQKSVNLLFNKIEDKFFYTTDMPESKQFIGLAWPNIFNNSYDEKESLNKFNYLIKKFGTIINCGVFGGKKQVIKNKLEQYLNYSYKTNDVYGLDTIVFNSIYSDNDIILKYKYNYLTKQNPKNKNGIFITQDDQEIVIMHTAGSSRIKREYFYPLSIF